ncbi:MAG: hypothetical protein P4M10_01295 [Verrucomicrobiae bacterium]|nr:hypothetical protein [Verrucomicrobiae bacterium]
MAIIAGLGSGGMAVYEFNTQIPQIKKQRDDEKDAKVAEIAAHTKTKGELKKTQGVLAQTVQELTDTKSERDKALARADAQTKRGDELQVKLTKTAADLQESQDQLTAYKSSGLTPDDVVKLDKNLKDAQFQIAAINGEKLVLSRDLQHVRARLGLYEGTNNFVSLRASLKGSVVVVDPKWDFVVLNIGDADGAIQQGELLVSREGKLVAKVIIQSVDKNRCIANIVPGWKLGEVVEGDVVTPAHPASS